MKRSEFNAGFDRHGELVIFLAITFCFSWIFFPLVFLRFLTAIGNLLGRLLTVYPLFL